MSEIWLEDAVWPEVGKLHLTSKVKAVYVLFGSISMIAAVFVFTTIFSVRKLRAHPSIMIGYISLFEAISWFHSVVWAVSTMEYIDYFGLEYLFNYTVVGDISLENSWYTLWGFNQILGFEFFQTMSLGMNIGLWIDLILTLREPFYPAKRRLKYYLLSSFILAIIVSSASIHTASETWLAPTSSAKSVVQNSMMIILLSLYILISCFSVVYAARMLSSPGISSDIRSLFMKKHLLYAISFIVVWSLILLNAFDQLYNRSKIAPEIVKEKEDDGYTLQLVRFPTGFYEKVWVQTDQQGKQYMDLTFFQIISFVSSISTGFIMGVIRCMEPYFHFLLTKFIKSLFGTPLSQNEIDKNNRQITDTIAAFLNSTLNIELVHIILKAITQECTRIIYKKLLPIFKFKTNSNLNIILKIITKF